ncbi:hypothetical protein BQ8794_440002 [Mesorhizobium prunaredense]|uniref:Uncharacterized protein n=1 Tax=Mesorhizobium prunaredense TaxID=1631249 RepID=A0A1R3VHG3_9HYPH|nr:hypothetical protein BQ8794_440002 [Mesorhizobium prunaredense]
MRRSQLNDRRERKVALGSSARAGRARHCWRLLRRSDQIHLLAQRFAVTFPLTSRLQVEKFHIEFFALPGQFEDPLCGRRPETGIARETNDDAIFSLDLLLPHAPDHGSLRKERREKQKPARSFCRQ